VARALGTVSTGGGEMSNTTSTRYVCDLCGVSADEKGTVTLPKGWVKLSIESRFEERSWNDKHVCPRCVSERIGAKK
jgi:predicted RNA-binding Zn-ribbon protein involved in translation (DUF1610 family)